MSQTNTWLGLAHNIFTNADKFVWKLILLPIEYYSGLVIISYHIEYKVIDFFCNQSIKKEENSALLLLSVLLSRIILQARYLQKFHNWYWL